MARQLVRSDEVRAPQALTDTIPEDQRKQLAAAILSGNTSVDFDNQQFVSIIASQFKQAQGGPPGLDQAPPSPAIHETQSIDEIMLGAKDGTNAVYRTQNYYIPSTLHVQLNGMGLSQGDDFTMVESGGVGTGYDTVVLINRDTCLPVSWEKLTASYFRNI